MFLPLQGGGQEGDGVFVRVVLNLPYRKINGTHKISVEGGTSNGGQIDIFKGIGGDQLKWTLSGV